MTTCIEGHNKLDICSIMFVNYNTLITVMYLRNTISVHDIKEYLIKCVSNCIHIIVNEPMCKVEKIMIKKNQKNLIFLFKSDFFLYLIFKNSGIHNIIKYFTIRLFDVNTATQVCALCAFVLKHTQNFVDLDACKQLFVLNSYKSAIKKIGSKKILNQRFFWSDLNQMI